MVRPSKRKETEAPKQEQTSTFVQALQFCSVCLKDDSDKMIERHVLLSNKWAMASNSFLTLGHPMTEDIYAAPEAKLLLAALKQCNEEFSLTQLDRNRLAVKSGKFRAVVKCLDPDYIAIAEPDVSIALINDEFRNALGMVNVLVSDTGDRVIDASVLLQPGTVVATNRTIIFEAWHGIDMPPGLVLPKAAVTALGKIKLKLVGFGFSQTSITFYYENGAWIKCQLYNDRWPENIMQVFSTQHNVGKVPHDFFKALNAIMPFLEDDERVFFDNGVLRSHEQDNIGAGFEVYGLPKGPIFNAKKLKLIEPYATTIDFMANGQPMLYFYGDKIRGLVMGIGHK